MALVLPHAPPKAAASHVPAALVPTKTAGVAAGAGPHAPQKAFQALLDRAAPSAAPGETGPAAGPVLVKAVKAKSAEAPERLTQAREAKEPRRAEARDARNDLGNLAAGLAASLVAPAPPTTARVDSTTKAAGPDTTAATVTDKSRSRGERRGATEAAPVQAVLLTEGQRAAALTANASTGRTEKGDDKPKVSVIDRRSDKDKERLKAAEAPAAGPVNAVVEAQAPLRSVEAKSTPGPEVQVSFQAVAGRSRDQGREAPAAATLPTARDAASFAQYLVDRGYGQLVDQARIVLKDQNAGEIRMTLYPESLGKVKVSLNLSDNSLAGQIYVENQTVKDVFQSNMEGLLQAFRDGGWNDLSLQVSVGGEGGAAPQGQPQPQAQPARDYGRQVAQTLGVEGRAERIGSWSDRQINLTA